MGVTISESTIAMEPIAGALSHLGSTVLTLPMIISGTTTTRPVITPAQAPA